MKTFGIIAYCDSRRTKIDGWRPPQKIMTGASENYAINLVKEWIRNHPKRYDFYCIIEETKTPGCKRTVTRVKYIAQRQFNLINAKIWNILELKENIESPE